MRAEIRIRKEPYYRRAAFESGLKRVGFTLHDRIAKPNGPDDWLVIWNRQNGDEVDADRWEAAGGTVIVAENGYLQREDKTHYAISVHGHNGSGWFPVGDEDRFSALGFPLKLAYGSAPPEHLIVGQRSIGSRIMRSPAGWAEAKLRELTRRAVSNRQSDFKARLRQHPGVLRPKRPLMWDIEEAAYVHHWASSVGVLALVEGRVVVHYAPHWVCAHRESGESREQRLHRMAHGQWHHAEIATGEPFARILAQRAEATW